MALCGMLSMFSSFVSCPLYLYVPSPMLFSVTTLFVPENLRTFIKRPGGVLPFQANVGTLSVVGTGDPLLEG